MRAFKNLDYFRKTAPEHTKPTFIGGLVSIMSFATIVLLFAIQVNEFIVPKISKDTYIAQDPNEGQDIYMNLDVTFPNAPCFLIQFDQKSSLKQSYDVMDELTFTRLSFQDSPLPLVQFNPQDNIDTITNMIKDSLENGEKCRIQGRIVLQRVTGQIIVSYQNKLAYVQIFRQQYPELSSKLRLNHVLESLTFGDVESQKKIAAQFSSPSTGQDHTSFDMMLIVDDSLYYLDDKGKDYFYFLKLVPHIFVDEINNEQYQSYSYSLNHNSKLSQVEILPTITITYDFAPINMKITKSLRPLARFLINLCAIIGGVFVLFGLVNRFLLSVKDSLTNNQIR